MSEQLKYLLAGGLLSALNAASWVGCWFGLPGTWMIVGLTAVVCFFFPPHGWMGLSWTSVAILGGLAVVGELWETAAAASAAKKVGGTRRGAMFAMIGALGGSLVGAAMGIPIPVIGSLVAAVAGGAAGAFLGAWVGEGQMGQSVAARLQIGKAAATGRVIGTLGKLAIGLLMVIISILAFFLPGRS